MRPAFTIVLAVLASLAAVHLFGPTGGEGAVSSKESAYERVMRTGMLRCGYYMFKPMSWKDPNTGEMQGMVVDFAKELETRSGIKMEWTEEVSFGTMFEGLKTGRYDAICTPAWSNEHAARAADFGRTWFYSAIIPIVKEEEIRIKTVADINNPNVTITTHEGDADDTLAKTMFPKAKRLPIAQSADTNTMEMNLFTGKADVILSDMNRVYQVNPTSERKLKPLSLEPLQLFPLQIAVQRGDESLNRFLDVSIESMHNDGTMDRIIDTYSPGPGAYLRLAKPFRPE